MAVVDGAGVAAQMQVEDMQTWVYKPTPPPATEGESPIVDSAQLPEVERAQLEAVAAGLAGLLGTGAVAQVRGRGCLCCGGAVMCCAHTALTQRMNFVTRCRLVRCAA